MSREKPLEDLELSARTADFLVDLGVKTVGELLALPEIRAPKLVAEEAGAALRDLSQQIAQAGRFPKGHYATLPIRIDSSCPWVTMVWPSTSSLATALRNSRRYFSRDRPMASNHGFDLKVSEDDEDVAYLKLPGHPGSAPGVVKRSLRLREIVGDYMGPDVNLDFGDGNVLIGIEIVG